MPLLDATGLIEGDEPAAIVANTARFADLMPAMADTPSIAIAFSAFSDGRGFSLARQLRQAGYRGRLRATGELIPDQFAFAIDCGFDEVEISDERLARQPAEQWLAALAAIDENYQQLPRTVDIFARRRAAREGASA